MIAHTVHIIKNDVEVVHEPTEPRFNILLIRSIKHLIVDLYMLFIYFCFIYKYNMKVISLNIHEIIFNETEKIVSLMKKPRNRYINEAIDFYNKHQRRLILERKLQKESGMVKEDSMNILRDFEEFDYGD